MKLNKRFQLRLSTKVNKLKTNAKATIRCFVSINGEKEIPFSTGCQIEPKLWSQEAQRIHKPKTDEQRAINETLSIIDGDLRDLFNEMKSRREPFTTRLFLNEYLQKSSEIPSFLEVWEAFLKELEKNVDEEKEGTICRSTYLSNQFVFKQFKLFMEQKKIDKDILPYAISKDIIFNFYDYLCNRKNNQGKTVQASTAYIYLNMMKKCMVYALKKDYINNNPFDSLQIEVPKQRVKKIIFLTEAELMRFFHSSDLDQVERVVVDGFIFMAFAGLTYSDFRAFFRNSRHFIKTDEDAYEYIGKARFKNRKRPTTQPDQHVPIIKILKEILLKYDYKIPVYSLTSYNVRLKEIAHRIGIENAHEITTYVGRKSAATFYINQDGVDIKTVAKIMGHKHESTTRNFYAVTQDDTVKRQISKLDL